MCHWLNKNFPSYKDRVTALSELLAALAIVASAATFMLQSLYWSKQVELTAGLVNSTPSMVSILITNSGGVDVAIKRILLRSIGVKDVDILRKEMGGKLLEKGKSNLETFDKKLLRGIAVQDNYLNKPDQPPALVTLTSCSMVIEMIDANGKLYTKTINFKCIAACFDIPTSR